MSRDVFMGLHVNLIKNVFVQKPVADIRIDINVILRRFYGAVAEDNSMTSSYNFHGQTKKSWLYIHTFTALVIKRVPGIKFD